MLLEIRLFFLFIPAEIYLLIMAGQRSRNAEASILPQFLTMPAWPKRMFRSMNLQLSSVYQNFHLIFGTAGYQPQQPSDEAIYVARELFSVLTRRRDIDKDLVEGLAEVKALLHDCHDLATLFFVTNIDGYNVQQVALVNDDKLFLQVLISEGCDLNQGKCSLPLHLACKLGRVDMVKFLLEHGARPNIETGMCYPKSHTPVRHVPSRFHFLETDIYACDSDLELPVMYAIQSDIVEIVKILMEVYQPKFIWPFQRQPLHHACKHGAYHSMQYLVSLRPQDVHDVDEEGRTPLLHAVKWGKRFAQYLVEAEANIHVTSSKKLTALHELFLHIQDPLHLYETTKFLLGTGLEQDISATDCNRNTALHILIAQVNCLVNSFPRGKTSGDSQSEFDDQVLQTLELLLVNNCDPNCVSNSGVTALHKLLLTFDFVISNDPTGITLETLPVREKYKIDFTMLHTTLGTLLKHGADPNIITGAGRTPLVMLLHSMLNVDPFKLQDYVDGFQRCITLLCSNGTRPSFSLSTHIATIITLCKFGHKCLSQRDREIKTMMSDFLESVLVILLQHGLNSNHCSLKCKKEVEGDSGNLLVELVKLAQFIHDPSDLDFVYNWVLTSLRWGANPDIGPYPSDSIICTSQSSIYLKPKGTQPVNQYMYQIQDGTRLINSGQAEKLLNLFYNSMDHGALYHCLGAAKVMSRFDPNSDRVPSPMFLEMITNLTSQPRSLKQMARVAIYKGLKRQLNLKVHQLPLPHALQDYLLNVE